MPSIEEAIERLKRLGNQRVAMMVWCEDDVLERAAERRITITRQQAGAILDTMDHRQDCSFGMTWDTIDSYLDELKPIPLILTQTDNEDDSSLEKGGDNVKNKHS